MFPNSDTPSPRPAEIVGRLAPSPTGPLHLGHARSFLVAWWQARAAGGRIVLRQEDLDSMRSSQRYRDLARVDMEWLGLDWDGGEWVQSEHERGLHEAAQRLLDQGNAYVCVCSRGDIQAELSAPHATDVQTKYPGTCRGKFDSIQHAESTTGKLAGVRARVPLGVVAFDDELCGRVEQDLAQSVGDFLILRRDKVPCYQLAVVVDDARQGVTNVVRGGDLLDSTPRQVWLAKQLGLRAPCYAHVPLVVDDMGRRLAKRSKGLSLQELRQGGVDPRRIVQWVAQTCAMPVAERVTAKECLGSFDLRRIPTAEVVCPTQW